MFTQDFSIFSKMVVLAKTQKLEYKILYSYHQRRAANDSTEVYAFVLATNLFSVTCKKNYTPDNTNAVKDFIKYNDCIQVDFEINPNSNGIELKNF